MLSLAFQTYVNLLFWYQFFCGFSGTSMTDYWILILFNLLFTSVPPIIYGVLDKDVSAEILMELPQLYTMSQKSVVGYRVHGLKQIEMVSIWAISVFLLCFISGKHYFKLLSLLGKCLGLCNMCTNKNLFFQRFCGLFPAIDPILSDIWMIKEIKDFKWSNVLAKHYYQYVYFIHCVSCQHASSYWDLFEQDKGTL